MRRLVLVKHSMPEMEQDKPASAWRLGEVGRGRAEELAVTLREFSPDMIWSSREPKAVETAEMLAGSFGVAVKVMDGLEEHHRGNVPFLPKEEFEGAVEHFFCNPGRLVLGTETADQALERVAGSIDAVVEAGHTDSVVVTHGTVISLYVASVTDIQPVCLWRRLGLPSYVSIMLPSMAIHSIAESVLGSDRLPTKSTRIC